MTFANFRYALRSLLRTKGFFATAVVTLGLALGLTTTSFGILDGVRHPYTPIRDPGRAFMITPLGAERDSRATVYERYRMIRDGTQFASEVSLVAWRFSVVRVGHREEQLVVQQATPNYLALTGIKPAMGRWFDSTGGPDESVVLAMTVWRTLFPGRKTLDGAAMTIDDRPRNVIGVLPDGAGGVYLPLAADRPPVPANTWGRIYARLKPGVDSSAAISQLAIVANRLNQQYGMGDKPFGFRMWNLEPRPVGGGRIDSVLGGVGLLVLIIACANLGGMMLARGIARRRDIALHLALGASRAAVVWQLVAEALVIAAAGCVLAVPVAMWGIAVVQHEMPQQIWYIGVLQPSLSWRVFAFAVAAAGLVGLVVGVLPGLRASQVNLDEPLKENSGNATSRRRERYSTLAIAELAMAMTLLMGTGLLVRAAHRIATYDFGFDPSHLVVTRMWLGQVNHSSRDGRELFQHLLTVAQQVPGVRGAAVLSGGVGNFPSRVYPDTPLPDGVIASANVARATTNFNEVLGVPMVAGRGLEPGDVGTDVAIVDQTAARQLWRGENPIGRTLKVGTWRSAAPWIRVVGVIRDAELGFQSDPYLAHTPVIYLPTDASPAYGAQVVARVAGNDAEVASALARAAQSALGLRYRPQGGVFVTAAGLEGNLAAREFIAALFGVFGACALGLSAVGLYAVLSYAVSQRRREFAVRVALGATSPSLFRLVAHDGLVMTLAGTGIGAFLAMASAKVLDAWLYGLHPVDALSLVAAEAVLCLVSLLACVAPARRAMGADPAEILRAV